MLKHSKQRDAIKNFLADRYDHPTAETVYLNIKKEFPNISLGTVYRNLSLLAEIGEIQKLSSITIGNGDDRIVYGTAENLIANFTGNGTIPAVTWSASPEGIVEITDDGKIKALKMGDVTISAKVEGADYSVEPVEIKSYIPISEIDISGNTQKRNRKCGKNLHRFIRSHVRRK